MATEITPRWLYAFAVGGFLAGVVVVLTLRPPRCRDSWTLATPGSDGECPVGGYVAEHPEVEGSALVVCRCRPEPRTYQPESRP